MTAVCTSLGWSPIYSDGYLCLEPVLGQCGTTPLIMAALDGLETAVQILLDNRVRVNQPDRDGHTGAHPARSDIRETES